MHAIDLIEFIVYMLSMLGIGIYFMKKNEDADDYFLAGRSMGSVHIGLSVVATDVGGGFSIGLGGLGFVMGLSGSWMLFTGLIGAWVSAVILIPKVKKLGNDMNFFTFPEIFGHFYDGKTAFIAGIISAIGYIGFTSSQILAGAKLASASFIGLNMETALLIMGGIIVGYTFMGGMKAVIYTDTVQWIILMGGLILVGIPVSYYALGGWPAISQALPHKMLTLSNISWQQLVNWGITIIPIWFVGMTLYQRIYASRDEKQAKKAWYLAGLFEWPIMAFMGVLLGLFAKVAAMQGMFNYLGHAGVASLDPEKGLPLLLRTVLPVGLMGIMMSAYFSAIMSTADSCLMAAAGNMTSDILAKIMGFTTNDKKAMKISQIVTLVLGLLSLLLASLMQNVLSLMLYSYAFMVSGLLIPIIGALFWEKSTAQGAFWAMLVGGGATLVLTAQSFFKLPLGLDANFFGISLSLIVFVIISLMTQSREEYSRNFQRKTVTEYN